MADPHSHSAGHHKSHIRKYWLVFVALVIGTIITVVAYFIHLPTVFLTVLVALLIASTKASLVAGWFMHLVGEKKMIYLILGFTFFFFLGMMFLTLWSFVDVPKLALP